MFISTFFIITTLLFFLFFYLGTGKDKRIFLISILWITAISLLAIGDFFQNTQAIPPRFLVVLIGNMLLVFYFFRILKNRIFSYPFSMLIHGLRIPVEVILYLLFLQRQVPKIMTFAGLNFDIIIGISAIVFLLFFLLNQSKPSKKILLLWNCVGLLFLLNIVTIAILSAPLPIQLLSFDQPNVAVMKFPFILLPSFIVPIVLITHILGIRASKMKEF